MNTLSLIEAIESGKSVTIENTFQELFADKITNRLKSLKEDVESRLFLKEYLTKSQEAEYGRNKMTDKARADTDHYFGKDNDVKHDVLHDTQDKSETHKKVEAHLGKEIPVDKYKQGLHVDKHGRDSKIGKAIKDDKLKQEYDGDSTRAAKNHSGLTVSTHRGTQIAGQTNSEPNSLHPKGHSWGEQSCKNNKDGSNKKYLKHEIKHGTVVSFLHDKDGKEIARAGFQPHHNDQGHVAYKKDSYYGVKHAGFEKHNDELEKKLSGEHKGGSVVYNKHKNVYHNDNDNDVDNAIMVHPNLRKEHLDKLVDSGNLDNRLRAAQHPNLHKEHLDKLVNDKDTIIRDDVARHPNLHKEHMDKLVDDKDFIVRAGLARHPNLHKEHLDKLVQNDDDFTRHIVSEHPNLHKEHMDKLVNDKSSFVRSNIVKHPNLHKEHIDKLVNDKDDDVRTRAKRHPNYKP